VGATLSTGITEIHHAYLLRDDAGSEQTAEVLVLGPRVDPLVTPRAATAGSSRG
jgi:hypothetical protein